MDGFRCVLHKNNLKFNFLQLLLMAFASKMPPIVEKLENWSIMEFPYANLTGFLNI